MTQESDKPTHTTRLTYKKLYSKRTNVNEDFTEDLLYGKIKRLTPSVGDSKGVTPSEGDNLS